MLASIFFCCVLTLVQEAPNLGPALKVEPLIDFKRDQVNCFEYCIASREFFFCFRDENNAVYRWNEMNCKLQLMHKVHEDERCDALAISPNGKSIILSTYGSGRGVIPTCRVVIIDSETNQVRSAIPLEHLVREIQFSDDEDLISLKMTFGPDQIFDLHGKSMADVVAKRFTKDSSPLVWLVPGEKSNRPQGLFLKLDDGETIRLHSSPDEFVVSKDKSVTACSTKDGEIVIWRTKDATELLRQDLGERVIQIRYDTDANRLIVVGGEKGHLATVSIVDLEVLRKR